MANLDGKSSNQLIGLFGKFYGLFTNQFETTGILDTGDATAVEFILSVDLRGENLANSMSVSAFTIEQSENIAFPPAETTNVDSKFIYDSLASFNFTFPASVGLVAFNRTVGVFNTQRYLRVKFNVGYVTNVLAITTLGLDANIIPVVNK